MFLATIGRRFRPTLLALSLAAAGIVAGGTATTAQAQYYPYGYPYYAGYCDPYYGCPGAYAYPYGYPYAYAAPAAVALGLGLGWGWGHHWGGWHGGWRGGWHGGHRWR